MKKILLFSFFIFSFSFSKAQQLAPPQIEWMKCYGGSQDDYAQSVNSTNDGGYIVAGGTSSHDGNMQGGFAPIDAFILKIDSLGNSQWIKKFIGSGGGEEAIVAYQTSDGGFIVGGNSTSDVTDSFLNGWHGTEDYWATKTDSLGNILWSKCYGGSDNDYLKKLIPSLDGSYYLVGTSTSTDGDISSPSGNVFCWVVKISSLGNIIWEKSYGTNYFVMCNNAVASNENGLYCLCDANSGWTNFSNGGELVNAIYYSDTVINSICVGEFWLLKLDSMGNIVWSSLPAHTHLPDCAGASAIHLNLLKNGNIFLSGEVSGLCAGNSTIYVLVDSNGYVVDSFIHFCYNPVDYSFAAIESSDSTIIIPYDFMYGGTIDKMDIHGNLIWRNSFPDSCVYRNIIQNSDRSLIACGLVRGFQCNYGMDDLWIVKFKNDSGTCLPYHSSNSISICPGDTFVFQGISLVNAGTYNDTMVAITGCDSIKTLYLSFENINPTIQFLGNMLSATGSGIIQSVQWIDCNTHEIIPGVFGTYFTPIASGSYAAVIHSSNCTDTSACISVTVDGINNLTENNYSQLSLYPNPVSEQLIIDNGQLTMSSISIYDLPGREIFYSANNLKSETINMKSVSPGVYFVQIKTKEGVEVRKIVKE